MSQPRRKFTAEQKADAVRHYLWDKVAVSDLAQELKVQPPQIHQWVQQAKLQIEQLCTPLAAMVHSVSTARNPSPTDRQVAIHLASGKY